jgi:hypothetical protein
MARRPAGSACNIDRRRGVAGFADDLEPFLLLEQRPVSFAHDGVVVDNEDADRFQAHCRGSAGGLEDEGSSYIDRLPTADEAEAIKARSPRRG